MDFVITEGITVVPNVDISSPDVEIFRAFKHMEDHKEDSQLSNDDIKTSPSTAEAEVEMDANNSSVLVMSKIITIQDVERYLCQNQLHVPGSWGEGLQNTDNSKKSDLII